MDLQVIAADYIANLNFFTSADWFGIIAAVAAIVLGIVFGLFGAKLYKAFIYISGFVFGYTAGGIISGFIGKYIDVAPLVSYIIKLAVGVLGFVLIWKLVRIGLFISTGTIGFIVIYTLTGNLYVALAAFVVAGVLGLLMQKTVVKISTSLSGGFLVSSGAVALILLIGNIGMSTLLSIIYLVAGLILSVMFMCAQFRNKKE